MYNPPKVRSLLSPRSYAFLVFAVVAAVWFGLWLVTQPAVGM